MLLKVAVIDDRESYRERFITALENDYPDKLEISSFSSLDNFYGYQVHGRGISVDVMLVSAAFGSEELDGHHGATLIYLVDDKSIERIFGRPAIGRYQKIDLIYKAILDACLDRFDVATFRHESIENTTVISFFPASGGVGASTMAAAAALGASKRGMRTFYLNLELYGNTNDYFVAEGTGNLSEALFAIEARKRNIAARIQSMTKRGVNGVRFLDTAASPLDVAELTADHVDQLIREIAASDRYDVIIVDLDYPHSPFARAVMEMSTRVVFVANGTAIANEKFARIFGTLAGSGVTATNGPGNLVLVYNNFNPATGHYLSGDVVPVVGAIGSVAEAAPRVLIDVLSNSAVFDELLNVDEE